jgi:manganese transport protein
MSLLELTLGILTSVGGFIDIGELVFLVQSGVKLGYSTLWALILGTIGIITFSELSGRIAAVTKKANFELVKKTLPRSLSLSTLIASTILNILTCSAEIGGIAIALQLLVGLTSIPAMIFTLFALIIIVWVLPFKFIERTFGLLGLFMLIFLVSTFFVHADLKQIMTGIIPRIPQNTNLSVFTYLYFIVGIVSSTMMPYEVYFYSSGAIEEKWTPKDLIQNKITSGVGMSLGALVAASLLILGHTVLGPAGITPELHGTAALLASTPLGKMGFFFALAGIIFAIAGAAIETALSGAYNISQYFNFKWGRYRKPKETPYFTALWILVFVIAFFIMFLGIDPVDLVEYAVIFSVLALPFTYYPILKTAADKKLMGVHASGPISKFFGWFYFIIITIIAVSAVPLMILSHMGQK